LYWPITDKHDGGHFFLRGIKILVKQTLVRQGRPTLTAVLKRNSRCGSASAVPMKVVYSTIFLKSQPNQCKRWLWCEAVFLSHRKVEFGCLFCNFNKIINIHKHSASTPAMKGFKSLTLLYVPYVECKLDIPSKKISKFLCFFKVCNLNILFTGYT
jgi:hypothetical protein